MHSFLFTEFSKLVIWPSFFFFLKKAKLKKNSVKVPVKGLSNYLFYLEFPLLFKLKDSSVTKI